MPAPVRRWWQHPALIIALLVVIPPAGIALAWTSRWGQAKKITATVLAGLWFLTPFLGDPPKKAEADSKPAALASASPSASAGRVEPPSLVGRSLKEAKAAALAAGFRALSHDASDGDAAQVAEDGWKVCFQSLVAEKAGAIPALDFGVVAADAACPAKDGDPIPRPKMPKVVGLTFAKASEALKPIGFQKIEPQSAFTDVTLPAAVDDWAVCFQDPAEGKEISAPAAASASLKLVAPGTGCPGTPDTRLRPEPVPTHDGDSGSTASGGSSSGGSSSGGSSSGGSSSAGSSAGGSSSGGSSSGGSSSGGSSSGGSAASGGSDSGGGGSSGTVTPGAFCSPAGATGVSKKGVSYTCKGPGQPRWRQ
ncbi:PASTA domain-containing protein [Streptomyces roseus]|uniref:PASTA domain-containing protein n=1 Tax=Streptomyces roseus TaxID=66430 RepID=UPI00131ECCA3|nr:PASTA domain-containing protein [Streptomyces roseus]